MFKLMMSRDAGVFVATEAFYGFGMGIYSFVFNLYLQESGINTSTIGMITSWGIIIMGILAIPVGLMTKHIGRKRLLVAGVVLEAAAILLLVFSRDIYCFYASSTIISIGLILVEATEVQVIYQACRNTEEQVTVFNIVFAVYTGMFGLGIIAAGFTSDFFTGQWWHYRLVLAAGSFILFVEALLRGLLLHNDIPEKSGKKVKNAGTLKDSRLLIFLALPLIQGVAMNFIPSYNNLIVKYRFNWNDSAISILLTATSFSLLLFSLVTPWLMKRFKTRTGFALAYVFNIAVTILLSLMLPDWIFIILFIFRGGSSIMVNNMLDSRIFAALPDEQRDIFAGARSLLRSIGGAFAAYVTGVMLQKGNPSSPFLLTAIAFAVSALWFFTAAAPELDSKVNTSKEMILD